MPDETGDWLATPDDRRSTRNEGSEEQGGDTIEQKVKIAHGLYMHNLERLNQFVHQMNNIIESSIAIERRNSGLLILDAYFGLDEHIY